MSIGPTVAGRIATAAHASYAASEWAFEALSECHAQEMRAFNVRVAIVEPGVIATPIATKVRSLQADSPYPHPKRLRALFAASRAKPTPPSVVTEADCLRRELAAALSRCAGRPAFPEGLS
jgi:NAD(P)-dependent dehydrogenase (short-subunit alcohol dehydrogenase family)